MGRLLLERFVVVGFMVESHMLISAIIDNPPQSHIITIRPSFSTEEFFKMQIKKHIVIKKKLGFIPAI